MGKTIRRKGVESNGAYDWKDDVRQRHGAGKKYFHSDMPGRNGLAHGVSSEAKVQASEVRRSEVRSIKNRVANEGDEALYFLDDRAAQSKSNEHWHFS